MEMSIRSLTLVLLALSCCALPATVLAQTSAQSQGPKLHVREIHDRNGRLTRTESYYLRLGVFRVLHGPTVEWNLDGSPFRSQRVETYYRHGVKDGPSTEWTTGNKIRSQCTYKNGLIVGVKRYWSPSSDTVVVEEVYDPQGRRIELTDYYDSGKKWMNGHFEGDGKKNGVWTYWDGKGRLTAQGTWKDGKPWDGICGVPAAGDAGSWAGIESFGRYKDGQLIEKVSNLSDGKGEERPSTSSRQ